MRLKLPASGWRGRLELIARAYKAGRNDTVRTPVGRRPTRRPVLFAREDAIEAQWRIVEPVLGDVTRVYEYEPNTWDRRG